ncbi:MAG: cytidylate kinase-like family protein [Eubacteriales bacterium]|nr:cytidylate kinase-like family protein [Eubacteriales bacterium]
MKKFSVVIARQFGSLGRPIAREMSELLGVEFYDRDIVTMVAKQHNITIREVSSLEEKATKYSFMKFPLGNGTTMAQDKIFDAEAKIIRDLAARESCIIVGRCADAILGDNPNNLNIFIYAPYEDRLVNCVNELGMDTRQAKRMIQEVDRARDAFHMRYAKYKPNDLNHMDIMVNSAMLGVQETAKYLSELVKLRFAD